MLRMLRANSRRVLARPRAIVYLAVCVTLFYVVLLPPLIGSDLPLVPWAGTGWGREKPAPPQSAPPKQENLDPYAADLRDRFLAEEQALAL